MQVRHVRKTVGLLGGSFNPAHDGHRYISLQALKLLGLDEVWWLVSPLNPLKEAKDMASYDRRLTIAKKIARHPHIKVSDIEYQIGTRYTIDTLTKLKEMFPDTNFVWLMGADNLLQIPQWYRWRDIMHSVPIAVFARKHYALKALHGKAARIYHLYRRFPSEADDLAFCKPPAWVFLPIRKHPASSTAIREKGLFIVGEKLCL
ncbi:MAG: nicotinate-nucleotide adenylyltransferase [Alphaproteobacteria bacterium]|nr:nicotinate-nucleotide adenylyltransferase [Alphaproteobacteria bacterium]